MRRAEPVRAAVIGYGHIGKVRARCLMENPQEWNLVGVCDVDAKQSPGGQVPFVQNWRELLKWSPEAVFVCVTNRHVPDIVVEVLGLGIHVFCEKPPGRTLQDVARMREAEAACPPVRLKFGFNHRYHASIQEAKAIVSGGRLGKVMWMRGIYGKAGGPQFDKNWRNHRETSGGGILLDQGIHMVDLFRHFCGEFKEVKSFIGRSYWPVEVEDNAFALLRNSQGQVAMLHSSATQWQHRFSLDIYLERGYLAIHGILSSTGTYGRESLKVARCHYDAEGYPLANPEETVTHYDEDNSWQREIQEFANAILNGEPVVMGCSTDAYKAMELVQKMYAADEEWEWPGSPHKAEKMIEANK